MRGELLRGLPLVRGAFGERGLIKRVAFGERGLIKECLWFISLW